MGESKVVNLPSYRLHDVQQQRSSQVWTKVNEGWEHNYGQA